ncbi:hypothetical protein A2897_01400 [Candidatus Woesebacteria bacterium RIFCSPLOWO2_01_FULL_44_24b]|nr:MAG: hypothetical protein A2897_01400 [Candidatus Woesebacteria bacterium RIFCSPLOWO2_01_FULL_44_24b]
MGIDNENNIDRARRILERETELILDEHYRGINSDVYNAYERVVDTMVKSGRLTKEQARVNLRNAEDYFTGIPEAHNRLKDKNDEDGWLTHWLTRHPEYVNEDLEGQWPEWLQNPSSGSEKGEVVE